MVFTSAVPDVVPVRRRAARLSVGVLVERRYLGQAQPAGLVRALRRAGADVDLMVADAAAVDLCRAGRWASADVVVARGRSIALLATLRAVEARGVPVVDTAAAVSSVVDKAGMAAELAAAGVPTPATWLGSPSELAQLPGITFPLVLKPVTGDNARGLRVVRSRGELRELGWPEAVAVAQHFHRGDAHDVKLYVAGRHTWAVRRPSPIADDGRPSGTTDPGHEIPLTRPLQAIADGCRSTFGLSLFGVDCVVGPDGPLAVEVNDFPNYRGTGGSVDDTLANVVLSHTAVSADDLQPSLSLTAVTA